MKKLFVLLAASLFFLSACDRAEISTAKKALERSLKDPSSVQYRDVKLTSDGVVCGEYNSKNGYGAYAGFSSFVAHSGSILDELNYEETNLLCSDNKDKLDIYYYAWAKKIYQEKDIESACEVANRHAKRYNENRNESEWFEILTCKPINKLVYEVDRGNETISIIIRDDYAGFKDCPGNLAITRILDSSGKPTLSDRGCWTKVADFVKVRTYNEDLKQWHDFTYDYSSFK